MNLKKYFTTGLLTLLPLFITLYIFVFVFNFLDNLIGPIFEKLFDRSITGLGFAIGLIAILLFGIIASNIIGKKIIDFGESLLRRIPLTKIIYSSARQIIDAFSLRKNRVFQKTVLIEYPRRGTYALGFVTDDAVGEIQAKTSLHLVNVFIPTTPNPTSGMLIMTPWEDVIELDMSIEDGMKVIISGGLVAPEHQERPDALLQDDSK